MKTISYDTFRSAIKKIVSESIKNIINEGISPIVWHFCPINSMYYIAEKNAFQCTSSEHNRSDKLLTSLPKQLKKGYTKKEKYGNGEERTVTKDAGERFTIDDSNITTIDPKYNKIYNYYMCVSRTPNSRLGYQGRRRTEGGMWSCFCRIELDGYKLMSDFKGMPVNYFTDFNSLADIDKDVKHYISNNKMTKTKTGKDKVVQQVYTNRKDGKYELLSEDNKNYFTDNNTELINGKRGTYLNKISTTKDGKKAIKKEFMPYNNTDVVDSDRTDMRQMSEYEDRIFSNKKFIDKFKKYIIRIDIFASKMSEKSEEILYEIKKITEYLPGRVFLYDNEVAFNSRNINYSINKGRTVNYNNISTNFLDNIDTSKDFLLNSKDASILGRYYSAQICKLFLFEEANGKRAFKGDIKVLKRQMYDLVNGLYVLITNALNITGDIKTTFGNVFKETLTNILNAQNPWNESKNLERMMGQRIPTIDACKNYLIKKANEIINDNFGPIENEEENYPIDR
jgi:hypothetical protein